MLSITPSYISIIICTTLKVKYDIPNDKPEMFGEYNTEIADVFTELIRNAKEGGAV